MMPQPNLDASSQLLADVIKMLSSADYALLQNFLQQCKQAGNLEFYQRLQQEHQQLLEVLQLNQFLNSERNVGKLLSLILDKAIHFIKAERGFIILGNDEKIAAARNFDQEYVLDPSLKISRSLAQSVMQSGKILIAADAQSDPEFQHIQSVRKLGLRSIIALPLKIQDKILGVLYLDNRFQPDAFQAHQLLILQAFADQVALAIHQAQLLEALQKAVDNMLATPGPIPAVAIASSSSGSNIQESSDIYRFGNLISANPQMQHLFELAKRASLSDVPILILGASGTGKGMLAQAIHEASPRKVHPFVAENCAAIPATLLESELFGYVKGAFTGATENRPGLLDQAHLGTLFLDEIAEMPLEMQAKLLRALEMQLIRPVGATQEHAIQIRLISATHQDPIELIQQKRFREDLLYRIQVVSLTIPKLKDRPEDIAVLAQHFLQHSSEAQAKQIYSIEPSALELLLCYDWPGNVRQLQHEIYRIVALKMPGEKITADDIAPEIVGKQFIPIPGRLSLKEAVQRFERNYILQTMQAMNGNRTKAAQILGLARRTLYNKISGQELSEH